LEIDFYSQKVIQCSSIELASLEEDDTIKSIGMGNTEKLSLLLTVSLQDKKKGATSLSQMSFYKK